MDPHSSDLIQSLAQPPLHESTLHGVQSLNRNMETIKQSNAQLFQLLVSFSQLQPIKNTEFLTACFESNPEPINFCLHKITYYYVCRTCKQNPTYKICAACFDLDFHRNHNYFTEIAKGDCDCGTTGCENRCSKHSFAIDYNRNIPKPNEKFANYCAFLEEFWRIFLEMTQQDRRKHLLFFEDILNKITKLNQQNSSYIEVSCYCLSLRSQKLEEPILLQILLLNKNENFLTESSSKFFRILLSCAPFQLQLLETVFSISDIYYTLQHLRILQGLVQKLLKSHMVVGQLAKRNLLIFPQSTHSVHFEYWNLIQSMMNYGSKHKVEESLIPISRLIFNRYGFYPGFSKCPKKQVLEYVYSRISSDQTLLSNILSQAIEKKVYLDISQPSSDAEWYNMIVRAVLYSVNGEINKFPLFFTSFKLETLKNFIRFFFRQAFRIRNKCKFNGLTAVCLFKLAEQYGQVDELNNLPIPQQISCHHFSNNLVVIFRNLVASDHLIALWLLKIAEYRGDEARIKEYRTRIAEWFHDFLCLRKQISQKVIESFKGQGLINFKEAAQILNRQTEYQEDRRIYIYKGRDRKLNPDILLTSLKKQFYLEDLKHGDYIDQFYKNKDTGIFRALFAQNIKRVSLKNYMSYGKDKIYMISVTAVILDQILKGQCEQVRIYAENLKELNQKLKKSDSKIEKLFSLQAIRVPVRVKQIHEEIKIEMRQLQNAVEVPKLQEENKREREMSSIELESSRKRAEKMQKIKDKFKSKSNKYSQHFLREKVDEQVCLICREARGKSNEKSFLFYLGSLKSDELAQLVFGVDKNDQLITSCFHPFHQKCMAHHNRTACILCKLSGNMILPAINQNPESELFLAAWWNDLLSLKSLAPKVNQPQSYYNPSPSKTPTADPEISKTQQERPFKNFIIIYRQLTLRLSSLFGKAKFEDAIKKHAYFYSLIENLYKRSTKIEKEQILKEIQYFQTVAMDSKVTEYVKNLVISSSKAIVVRLAGEQEQKTKEKCRQVIRNYPKKLTEDFILNICWLLDWNLEREKSEQNQRMVSNSQMVRYVYNINVPTTMAQVYENREECKLCHRMTEWFCIFCRCNGCRNCQAITNHSLKYHGSGALLAIQTNGKLVAAFKGARTQEFLLYQDIFNCPFNESESVSLEQFKFSPQKLNTALEGIFKKF